MVIINTAPGVFLGIENCQFLSNLFIGHNFTPFLFGFYHKRPVWTRGENNPYREVNS